MYFRIFKQKDGEKYFGFIFDEDATDLDYPIRKKDYDEFFRLEREEGKSFRLKETFPENPTGLFDYLEEYTPVAKEFPPSETDFLKEQLLQQKLATAEAVEKQETDKIEQQLAQAEMFETILQMLEPQGGGE